jgi:hypothetical protein
MAIEVNLVLPNNLKSTFLKGDFIDSGQTYTTLIQSDVYARDNNRHQLVFGFNLVDSDTREPVDLTRIKSLKISNDPDFDVPSTFEIANWPEDPDVYDSGTIFTYDFDPEYFFSPDTVTPEGAFSTATTAGSPLLGYFVVNNWPLSSTGGLSTVYFKVVLEANSEEVLYPGSYGIFDQIFWQTDRPSTPGPTDVQCVTDGWVGRKYGCKFRASEESSTGRFNNGVARYLGDIIEIRKNAISSGVYNIYSTRGSATSGNSRSILPNEAATSIAVSGYNFQYATTGFASNAGRVINSNLLLDTSEILRGAALYTATANKITLSTISPDFCVQAHVQMSLSSIDTESKYYIKAYTGTFDGTSGSVDEVVVCVTIPSTTSLLDPTSPTLPTACVYRLDGAFTTSDSVCRDLPINIVPLLLSGGLLELYVGNFDEHDLMHVEAYFTPDNPNSLSNESFLLTSTLIGSKFGDTAALGGAVACAVNNGDGTFKCKEITIASGRFLLGVDLGDCFKDDKSEHVWLSANTTGKNWNTLIANGNWMHYTEFLPDLVDLSRSEDEVGPIKSVSSDEITLVSPGYLNQKTVSEIQCSLPTMSSRSQVIFNADVNGETGFGEYYVAFSQYPVTTQLSVLRPMITRCDPYQNETDEPLFLPTIAVCFSPIRGLYVSYRNENNTLATKTLSHFIPKSNGADLWKVVISTEPSTGSGDVTSIVVSRNNEVVGRTIISGFLPPHDRGLGFYVSLGSRSEKSTQSEDSDTYKSECTFSNVLIEGLEPIHYFGDDDAVSVRHFQKYNTGASSFKPLMGQFLINGQTDANDFEYSLSHQREIDTDDESDYIINVAAVTIGDNIPKTFDCPTGQLDLVETTLGDYQLCMGDLVLVKDQDNPIENGIYEVKFNAGIGRYYWERWDDLNTGVSISPPIDGEIKRNIYVKVMDRWKWYENCRVATTNVVADFNAVPVTIDGITVDIGDRVLVCQESSNFVAQGIYVVSSINAGGTTCVLTRSSDLNTDSQLNPRIRVRVDLGTTYGNTYWGFKMVAQSPPSIPYELGVTEIHIHRQPFNLMLEPCRYASNINLSLNGLTVGSYTLDAGDRILVKSQTIQSQNGIYIASAGAWTRATDFNAAGDLFPQMAIPVKDGEVNKITRWTIDDGIHDSFLVGSINIRFVKIPNLEGMLWYLNIDTTIDTIVDTHPLIFKNAVYAQKIDVPEIGLNTSFTGELLELKIRNNSTDFTSSTFPSMRLHLYDEDNSVIGPPVTDWVPADRRLGESFVTYGGLASKTDLVQFDMNNQPLYLDANRAYFIVVRLAPATSIRTANANILTSQSVATGEFHDINVVNNLYYKLFARSMPRFDNTTHLAAIHSRVRADSHARVEGSASPLSGFAKVDLSAPTSSSVPGRPYVQPTIVPSVRSAILSIDSEDDDSGMLAFRVGKENHYGMVEFTSWQPWNAFINNGFVEYTTYLYGTWWKNSLGAESGFILSEDNVTQNIFGSTSDGSRKVWVQVMDGVGNISESYPLTLIAQGLALIDTTPPSGSLDLLSKRDSNATNEYDDFIELNGNDITSAVKDVRFRALKAGTARAWSNWQSYEEFVNWTIDNDIDLKTDGLKRIEAQFRDYGNNIEYEAPLWDSIYDTVDKNVMFINMVTSIRPGETNETLYLSGIKSEDYVDLDLVDSFSKDYPDNTAYYAFSSDSGSEGRQIRVRSADNVVVSVNSTPTTEFTIDGARGLIIMNNPVVDGDVLTANIHRDYAVIYKWDGDAVLKVVDMSYYNESAILSMVSTHLHSTNDSDNFILLGGASGNIWKFNGSSISGPVFTASESNTSLPITTLTIHQFVHETSSYVYAGTASFPRLFRASLSVADSTSAWDSVANIGYLQGGIGDITCACSAYNMLFIGTNNGRILRYERTLTDTTSLLEQESLTESHLKNEYIGEYESDTLPVSCLLATDEQVLAGIGDRPEVWNFVLNYQKLPNPLESWSRQNFNRWFVNNPTPWQAYGADDYVSLSGTPNYVQSVTSVSISDPDGENGYKDMILISSTPVGGVEMPQVQYIANTGSDWEQLISNNAPSNTLQNVVYATTENLPFLPTYDNGTSGVGATLEATIFGALQIDGQAVTTGQRVLIKNQNDKTQNGIYTLTTVGDESTNYVLTRAVDLDGDSDFVSNLYVTATSGDLNKDTGWLLHPSESYITGTTEIVWQKPGWAIEFEMMHHTGGEQGFKISDGYYVTNVSLSTTNITISSGSKSKSVPFRADDIQMLSVGSAKYPASNVKKIWNFFGDDSLQDRGPYWTGESEVAYNLDDWNTYRFVEPNSDNLGVGKSEPETSATFTTTTEFLRVTPTSKYGTPRFGISGLTPSLNVDSKTKVYLRLRLTNKASNGTEPSIENHDWSNLKIRFAWSEASFISENTSWYELDAKNTDGFELYVFEPSWNQTLRSLAIEISGMEEGIGAERPFIDIDYLALVSDDIAPNLSDNLTPIRLAVEGKDVKVWVGKSEQPLLNEINFLTLESSEMEIRFGKIDSNAEPSMWSWGYVQFTVGGTESERLKWAPLQKVVYDFNLQHRFPSTGGVRCLTNYQGSAWALTDGISNMKISDNPNDRAIKAFEYISEHETWRLQDSPCPRETNGMGITRPFAATSYYGTLVVAGERRNIQFPT